jgi:hypothetical protein
MQPTPPASGRSARLALVSVALLVLLAIVAYASRSGLGHQSQAAPTPGYVSYAFTAFLIVFVLMIPVAMYVFVIQAREGEVQHKSFSSRVIQNIGILAFFLLIAFVIIYMKRHNSHIFNINTGSLKNAGKAVGGRRGKRAPFEPRFEWGLFWVAVAVIGVTAVGLYVAWRRRKLRTPVPLERASVSHDFVAEMSSAIDDLEAEPDARRAVIAAYARMEGVLGRHGLRRRPSETSLEYLRRVLRDLTSRADAVTRLTSLFEQAKFSRHEIDSAMKQDAIGALREIRDDLQGSGA